MNCGKGRRKKSSGTFLELIGPALIPSAALAAVPRTPAPEPPPGTPIGLATSVFNSSFPRRKARNMGEAAGEEGTFSDPESSLFDYNLMEEAGYSSVGFGAAQNRNRISYSDRDRVPTPTAGIINQAGNMYHWLDPEEADGSGDPDLYAIPAKGPGRKKDSAPQDATDGASLDRTQQEVRRAYQDVQNMDRMPPMSQNRPVLASFPGSSSGRGTMRDEFGDDSTDDDVAPPMLPPLSSANVAAEPQLSFDQHSEAYVMLREDMAQQQAAAAESSSGRISSQPTPRDAAMFNLEVEVARMQEENQHLHEEVLNLRKVASAIGVGDKEGAATLLQSHQVEELKGENEILKNTVGRLNQELSHYQAKYRPLSDGERSRLQGLPNHGPVPTWLIDKRYLAPLFLAYDDAICEKEEALRQCQQELENLKRRAEEVVRENQRYQLQGKGSTGGAVSVSEWTELQEQARLVLEENQVLLEQVEVQKAKVKDMSSNQLQEVSRLTKRLTVAESEKLELEKEVNEMRQRYKDMRYKHDQLLLNMSTQMSVEQHFTSVTDLKRSVTEEKEQLEKEREKMAYRMKAVEEERRQQTLAALEVSTENKQLRAEVKSLHRVIRKLQDKLLILQKAIEQSENKELITINELANVIKIVEKATLERDTAFRVVKEQQRDSKQTVNRMVGNSVVMGKLEERLKMYKLKASEKLHSVAEKLKEQDDSFNRQKQEYEREIRHLQLLLKEKEELIQEMERDKKAIEEDLEMVWQAARTENRLLKDTLGNAIDKLRQHVTLKHAFDNDDDIALCQFSE